MVTQWYKAAYIGDISICCGQHEDWIMQNVNLSSIDLSLHNYFTSFLILFFPLCTSAWEFRKREKLQQGISEIDFSKFEM